MAPLPPIATTSVGSMPRPAWLARQSDLSRSELRFALEGTALQEAQDDATRLALADQETAGIDLLTDGEQRREQFIYHVLSTWDGVDVVNRGLKSIRRRVGQERPVPRIVGRIVRRTPAIADDLRYAMAQTSRPIKMAVPGPMTIVDSTVDEAYGDEAALAMDAAAALNAELRELQAAGAAVLQIDEPAMTRFPEKIEAYGAGTLDRCLDGITVPTIVHLCYGYPGGSEPLQHEYGYEPVLKALLYTKIGGASLEFARSGFDPGILSLWPDRLVMLGCVDPSDTPPELLDVVVERVRGALRYVDPERLLLAPDCGLMMASRDNARAKLATLVEAAARLRGT